MHVSYRRTEQIILRKIALYTMTVPLMLVSNNKCSPNWPPALRSDAYAL